MTNRCNRPISVVLAALALVTLVRVDPAARGSAIGRIERLDPRFDALVPRDSVLELVADGIDWAEGPLWNPRDGSLLFSDVPRNGVFRWKPGAAITQVLRESGYAGATQFAGREPGSNGLTFDRNGRLVMCQHGNRRIVRRERDGRITVLADRYEGRRLNSPNDLVYHSNGDLYFTDPPFGLPQSFNDPTKELPFQGVYRLKANGHSDHQASARFWVSEFRPVRIGLANVAGNFLLPHLR